MNNSWQDWRDAYDHLTLHIVPGPRSFLYFVPFMATPAILMISPARLPFQYIRLLVLPVLVSIQIYDWLQHQSFDVISMNNVLMMFMLLGWYDVRKHFKRVVRNSDHKDYSLQSYPKALMPRWTWIGLLLMSLRLTDWHIGMPSHDRRQPSSIHPFKSYIRNTVAHSLFVYVLLTYTSSSTGCTSSSSLIFLARLYAILALYNSLLPTLIALCIIVPGGMQDNAIVSPLTWPSHFGSFSSIYTKENGFGLRAFWGVFWHQNMRYLTSTPGLALASLLALTGTSRYIFIVCASFFWSGVVHMGVIPAEPLNGSSLRLRLRLASFFWLQPVGIAIEVLVESLLKNQKSQRTEKQKGLPRSLMIQLLILCWTCGFLAITAGWTIRPVGCIMSWWSLPLLSIPRLI